MVPKTTPFKKIKASALATQARLRGEQPLEDVRPSTAKSNGDATTTSPKMIVNGTAAAPGAFSVPPRVEPDASRVSIGAMVADDDPSEQLAMEMRQATGRDGDVDMSG